MDKQKQKIEDFLNNYIVPKSGKHYAKSSKDNNRRYLLNILDTMKNDMDNINQVIQFIETIEHEPTLLKNLDSFLVYARHYNLVDIKILEAFRIQKHENKTVKIESELVLPDKVKLLEIVKAIPEDTFVNVKHKCLLNILLTESWVLRTDLATVMYRNFNKEKNSYYQDGVVYFHQLKKTLDKGEQRTFSQESVRLLDLLVKKSKSDFLFVETITKDKNDAFTTLVKNASKIHFKEPYSVNIYRKINTSNSFQATMTDDSLSNKEKIITAMANTKSNNHSLSVAMEYYVKTLPDTQTTKINIFYYKDIEIKIPVGNSVEIDGIVFKSI